MWKNLNKFQKVIFVVLISIAVPFAPELIFVADIGGMELVFGFLIIYYKPILMRLQLLISQIKFEMSICSIAFKNSSVVKPKVYLTQTLFYTCAFVISGSILYASVFLLPALIFNNVLV